MVQKFSKSELQTFRKKPEETEVIKVINEINQGSIVELKDETFFQIERARQMLCTVVDDRPTIRHM